MRLLSLLLLAPTVVLAQGAAPAAAATAGDGPSLLPMVLVLAFVLALIPVSMWLLKRMGAGGPAAAAGMKVVAQLPLGPRERLVVVEAGERWLLLGVTPSNINRVGTLPKGALPAGASPAAAGFAQLLNAARRSNDKSP
jgi:flagellar protein FliO/FliZ